MEASRSAEGGVSWTGDAILAATGGRGVAGDRAVTVHRISLDSRELQPDSLFVAIRGVRFDGHRFVAEAVANGARVLVVDRQGWCPAGWPPGCAVIEVEQTVAALGVLAAAHRGRFTGPVVAVTGSNGKTTAKELTAAALGTMGSVLKTPGTRNNRIGVPLTLFQLGSQHGAAVLELGTDGPGQIRDLARIVQPTVRVIVNVGDAHLAGLGGREGVAQAKGELLEDARPTDLVVLNGDDPWLARLPAPRGRVRTFGIEHEADVQALGMWHGRSGLGFRLVVDGLEARDIRLAIVGRHQVYHALAALTVAIALGADVDAVARALGTCRAMPGRLEVRRVGAVEILDDSYNANPVSMRAAMDVLARWPATGRRFLVMGDMLDLGPQAAAWHAEIGACAAEMRVDGVIAVGTWAAEVVHGARAAGRTLACATACATIPDGVAALCEIIRSGDVVLVKGSRGMAMEGLIDGFQRAHPTAGISVAVPEPVAVGG